MKVKVKRFSIIGLLVALFACVLLAFVPHTATAIADEPQTPVIEGTTGAGTAEDPVLVDEYLELVAAVNADVTNIKLTSNLAVQIPYDELPSKYFLRFDENTEYNLDLNGYQISITNLANRFLTGDFSVITVDDNAVLNVKNGLIDFENGMIYADSINANPFIYIERHGKLNSTNVTYVNYRHGNTIGLSSHAEAVIKGGDVWAESGYAIHAVGSANLTLDWNVKLSTRSEIGAYYAGSETGVGALFFDANGGDLTVEAATFVGGVVVYKDQLDEFAPTSTKELYIDSVKKQDEAIYFSGKSYYDAYADAVKAGNTYNWAEIKAGFSRYYVATLGETKFEYVSSVIDVRNIDRNFGISFEGLYEGDDYSGAYVSDQKVDSAKYGSEVLIKAESFPNPDNSKYEFVYWECNQPLTDAQKYSTYFTYTVPYGDTVFTAHYVDKSNEIERVGLSITEELHTGDSIFPEIFSEDYENYVVYTYDWYYSTDGNAWYEVDENTLVLPDRYYRAIAIVHPKEGYYFSENLQLELGADSYYYEISDDTMHESGYVRFYVNYTNPEYGLTRSFECSGLTAVYGTFTIDEEVSGITPGCTDYVWYRDGVVMEGVTGNSYTFTKEDGGCHFVVLLMSDDGMGEIYYTEFTCSKALGVMNIEVSDIAVGTSSNGTFANVTVPEGAIIDGYDIMYVAKNGSLQPFNRYSGRIFEPGTRYVVFMLIEAPAGNTFHEKLVINIEGNGSIRSKSVYGSNRIGLWINLGDTLPANPFDVTIEGSSSIGDTLTANIGELEAETITYQWYCGATPINGATEAALAVTGDLKSKDIYCKVTADGKVAYAHRVGGGFIGIVDVSAPTLVGGITPFIGNDISLNKTTYTAYLVEIHDSYDPASKTFGNRLTTDSVIVAGTTYYCRVLINQVGGNKFESPGYMVICVDGKKVEAYVLNHDSTRMEYVIPFTAIENGTEVEFLPSENSESGYVTADGLTVDTAKMAENDAEFKAALDAGKVTYTWYVNSHLIQGVSVNKLPLANYGGDSVRVKITYGEKTTYSKAVTVKPTYIESLDIAIPTPIIGEKLTDYSAGCLIEINGKAYAGYLIWIEPSGYDENTVFEAGTEYRLLMQIYTLDGAKFPAFTSETILEFIKNVTINGVPVSKNEAFSLKEAENVWFSHVFTPIESHTHVGVKQNGKAASCTQNGWKDYYLCEVCCRAFTDSACTDWIADFNAWKNGDGKIEAKHESTEFTYVSNGDGTHIKMHACCGEVVATENCSGGNATCTTKATCEKCNTAYGDTLTHSHGSAWEKDESGHWNECVCGDKANFAEHNPDRANATETDPIKCTICGYIIEPVKGHVHAPKSEWKSDEDNHWHECTGCEGQQLEKAAHVDSDNNGKCDTCEYDMPTTPGGGSGSETPEKPDEPKDGLSGGAIAGIVVGSVAVAGVGGFALVWFVIKKKSFADLIAIFKKK